jgi:amino-acid N-acetyltransferase
VTPQPTEQSPTTPSSADRHPSAVAAPTVRRARVTDVRAIKRVVDVYAGPILLEKTLANLFEDVTEFWVAEVDGRVVGCGALHVLWEDLGEIRTIAALPEVRGRGVGAAVCRRLIAEARDLGLQRLFCLTFEVDFFASLGFQAVQELNLGPEAYAELRRSYDRGVAEFLDLPYVKPNTLGNTRMLLPL